MFQHQHPVSRVLPFLVNDHWQALGKQPVEHCSEVTPLIWQAEAWWLTSTRQKSELHRSYVFVGYKGGKSSGWPYAAINRSADHVHGPNHNCQRQNMPAPISSHLQVTAVQVFMVTEVRRHAFLLQSTQHA
jgi:hypothetical protein